MITQRILRYQKKKVIGGNLLKNVYDRVKGIISTGSKIINRVPVGIRSELKKLIVPLVNKVPTIVDSSKIINRVPVGIRSELKKLIVPLANKVPDSQSDKLNDRSRAILSNLIAGSGFRNYIN